MDPRLKLYSDILQRYEFISWTPIEDRIQGFMSKLNSKIDSIPDITHIPPIRKTQSRCYLCAKPSVNHECQEIICEFCDKIHGPDLICLGELDEINEAESSFSSDKFTRPINIKELLKIRCFKCRRTGHICP